MRLRRPFNSDRISYLTKFETDIKKIGELFTDSGWVKNFHVDALRFCLNFYLKTKDSDLLQHPYQKLEAYGEGGLFDRIEGGFSATRRTGISRPPPREDFGDSLKLALLILKLADIFAKAGLLRSLG